MPKHADTELMEADEEGESRHKSRISRADEDELEGEARPPDFPRFRFLLWLGLAASVVSVIGLFLWAEQDVDCSKCAYAKVAGNFLSPVNSQFGPTCYSLASAKKMLSKGNGAWPGISDFTEQNLPPEMIANPSQCFQLPEGWKCYADEKSASCSSSSAPHDWCAECPWVDHSGVGLGWRKVSSPKFGDRCYNIAQAAAKLEEAEGRWPGTDDFTASSLPKSMLSDPNRCVSLPDGLECFKNPGADNSFRGEVCHPLSRLHAAFPPGEDCSSCDSVDQAGLADNPGGFGVVPVDTNSFGNGTCYTYQHAGDVLIENRGEWPGKPGFNIQSIPDQMRKNPDKCFQLPEGFPCFDKSQRKDTEHCRSTVSLSVKTTDDPLCGQCATAKMPDGTTKPIQSALFGNKCYTMSGAQENINLGGGHWPGIVSYVANALPEQMNANPKKCYQLPEGFECMAETGSVCGDN